MVKSWIRLLKGYSLVGVSASPMHPIADHGGSFNYAINQDHEFFRGQLPAGTYTVLVTDANGARAEARFQVSSRAASQHLRPPQVLLA